MEIEIKLPDTFLFKTTLKIRIDDINYGNHFANDKLLTYAHETRVQFFNQLGYTELDIEGTGIIMTESAIKYVSEGLYGQELTVEMGINKVSDLVLDFIYIFKQSSSKKEVARVFTKLVSFDYTKRKVCRFNPIFLNQLHQTPK